MIRLSALHAFSKLIQQWCCRLALPVVISAWSLSLQDKDKQTWHSVAPPMAFALMMMQYIYQDTAAEKCSEPLQVLNKKSREKTAAPRRRNTSSSSLSFVEMPTDVLATICGFLHPRDATVLCCLNKASVQSFGQDEIWKNLWYRDYGEALLQWQVGRQVLSKSLSLQASSNLEDRLSHHLNRLENLKEFYFVFGEIYTDYLLAGRNNAAANNCYLGLHGHILDFASFAEYHPGLALEEVLIECGQDATAYFEQLPHSTGARAIARQLVVLVHQGILDGTKCGFWVRTPPANLKKLLRLSNSRPVTLRDSVNAEEEEWLRDLIPQTRRSPRQRPPTLERIRSKWDADLAEQRALLQKPIWETRRNSWRVYYDPLQQEWIRWNAAYVDRGLAAAVQAALPMD